MIVPMKKVTVVLTEDSQRSSLKVLRKAGVLHLERESDDGHAPESLTDEAERLEQAVLALPKVKSKDPYEGLPDRNAAGREAEAIIGIVERKKIIQNEIIRYGRDIETLAPWGDFDPSDLRILSAQGIDVRLLEADGAILEEARSSEDGDFVTLDKGKGVVFGAMVYRCEPEDGGIPGLDVPENGLSELHSLIAEKKAEIATIETELQAYSRKSRMLEASLAQAKQDVEFEEVRSSLSEGENLAWFTGYIPAENIDSIKTLAVDQSWGLLIRDPDADDPVPTLLKNNKIVRMIQPVFDLMGIAPGYRETDISVMFLIFLSVFVAMILGDAGYGAIILIACTVIRIKSRKSSDALRLVTLFGFTTLLWGVATGTWFGSLQIVANTPLKNLVIPAIATYQQELFPGYSLSMGIFPEGAFDSNLMIQWISILLGIVMLSIARIQSFIKKLPALSAFAQLGWLGIVVSLYWLIMQLVLQLKPIPQISSLVLPVILGGLGMVLIFSGQEKGLSFFKGIINGLKNILPIALDSIGAFGDIISFIRLFAVGLAGVALSQSFNSMAPQGGGFAVVAAVLILTFGHTLNLVLNALSVLVHGVRLNVLEFSGHLDIEWAGINFDPFRLHVPVSESPETDKE